VMLPQVLIYHGLFPFTPSKPWMAIYIDLLTFYCTLFEWSCNVINVLAAALQTHYIGRGFRMTTPWVSLTNH
ncbi:hypothetical protein SERLA73DRAFT_28726, partial [Serpula lacrymans var. lacrymans S7.3]